MTNDRKDYIGLCVRADGRQRVSRRRPMRQKCLNDSCRNWDDDKCKLKGIRVLGILGECEEPEEFDGDE